MVNLKDAEQFKDDNIEGIKQAVEKMRVVCETSGAYTEYLNEEFEKLRQIIRKHSIAEELFDIGKACMLADDNDGNLIPNLISRDSPIRDEDKGRVILTSPMHVKRIPYRCEYGNTENLFFADDAIPLIQEMIVRCEKGGYTNMAEFYSTILETGVIGAVRPVEVEHVESDLVYVDEDSFEFKALENPRLSARVEDNTLVSSADRYVYSWDGHINNMLKKKLWNGLLAKTKEVVESRVKKSEEIIGMFKERFAKQQVAYKLSEYAED